jgi:two-component system cell cycle sensor histidine kinase/response regulator CckA
MKQKPLLNPVSISCIYATMAASWILFSDTIAYHLGLSPGLLFQLSVAKGITFVAVTSFILYLLVRKMVSQMEADRSEHDLSLRQSEERFAMAFNSSPEAMAISSMEDGRYLEVNETFLSLHGYKRNEVIGRTTFELGIWADPNQRNAIMEKLLQGEPIQGVVVTLRDKNGRLLEIEFSARKILLNGKYYLLGIGRDVSLQRQLERQFLEAQKMEALGQLAASIAHDFKNLLMLIRGFSEMLKIEGLKNVEYRQQVLTAVDKADTLTRQLLAFSRKQKVHPEVLNLNDVVSELSKMIGQMFPKTIHASSKLDPGLWPILSDRGQLEQVLMNLAVNAQDAMPAGGNVVISTANRTVENNFVGPDGTVIPAAEYVEAAVSDSGSGIRPEILPRIFEPFFTTKERGKGTGLGLAAVYGIVKQSNGFTLVETREGVGTTFRILLPRHVTADHG